MSSFGSLTLLVIIHDPMLDLQGLLVVRITAQRPFIHLQTLLYSPLPSGSERAITTPLFRDIIYWPIPAIVPPVPVRKDHLRRGYRSKSKSMHTGTTNESIYSSIRLTPNLRASSLKVGIKITPVLMEWRSSPCSYVHEHYSPRIGRRKNLLVSAGSHQHLHVLLTQGWTAHQTPLKPALRRTVKYIVVRNSGVSLDWLVH